MAANAGDKQPGRGGGRPFSKGQSGNPTGKPKGTRHHATMAAEAMLEGEAAAITRKAISMALEGDSTAMRLVTERVVPLRRGKPVRFDFPPIEHASDVSKALGDILRATSQGELTPDEAAMLAGILEAKRKAIETVDVEARLAALEKATEGKAAR